MSQEVDSIVNEENSETILNDPIKVNILISINGESEEAKSISVRITDKVIMLELLKESIDMFNEYFYMNKIPLELNKFLKNYTIRPSKKSGKPDNDLPST